MLRSKSAVAIAIAIAIASCVFEVAARGATSSGYYVKTIESNGALMRRFTPAGDRRGGWSLNAAMIFAVDDLGRTVPTGLVPPSGFLDRPTNIHASAGGHDAVCKIAGRLWRLSPGGGKTLLSSDDSEFLAFASDDHLWLSLNETVVQLGKNGRTEYKVLVSRPQSAGDGRYLWALSSNDTKLVLLDALRPDVVTKVAELPPDLQPTASDEDAVEIGASKMKIFLSPDGTTCWVQSTRGVTAASVGGKATTYEGASDIILVGKRHAFLRTVTGWALADSGSRPLALSPPITELREAVADADEKHFWIVSGKQLFRVGADGAVGGPLLSNIFDFEADRKRYKTRDLDPFTLSGLKVWRPDAWHKVVHKTDRGDVLAIADGELLFLGPSGKIRWRRPLLRPYEVAAAPKNNVFWITADGPHLWAVGSDGSVANFDLDAFPAIAFGRIDPSQDGKHLFTEGGRTTARPYWIALVDRASAAIDFSSELTLAKSRIDTGSTAQPRVTVDPMRTSWKVDLDWPGLEARKRARAVIEARLDDKAKAVIGGTHGEAKPVSSKALLFSRRYPVTIEYTDAVGSSVTVRWPGVAFEFPLLQNVSVRSFLCAFLIVAVALLGRLLLRNGAAASWTPSVFAVMTTISAQSGWLEKKLNVDGTSVALYVATAALLAVPLGLLEPRFLRRAAAIQPYQSMLPLLLQLPSVRRRMYREYLDGLAEYLRGVREAAVPEIYCELPAAAEGSRALDVERIVAEPAPFIASAICRPSTKERSHVLISAPGGRGKSALLRRVAQIALERFLSEPRLPIPILCNSSETSVEAAAKRALGRNKITDEIFDRELFDGRFVLLIDGISESGLRPDAIEKYIGGPMGDASFLLVASRPSDELKRAFKTAPRWYTFSPERLDDSTLPLFETSYTQHDSTSVALTPTRKRACAAADGTYLPLLVRWALQRSMADDVDSIAKIYQATFRDLLKAVSKEAAATLLEEASALCVETYWHDGYRAMAYDLPKHRRTLDALIEAGVLIKIGVNSLSGQPREVRFFHDSMQSYLTARGLLGTDWTCLERAAGDPIFVQAESDLVTGGSELFQFCLETFAPRDKLLTVLAAHLRAWAKDHDGDLKKNELIGATSDIAAVVVPKEASAGTLLNTLVTRVKEDQQMLAKLYARIAPLIWSYRKAAVESALGLAA